MKDFGILRLKVNDKPRMMHYTTDDNYLYLLSTSDTSKIDEIKESTSVEISFDLKDGEFIEKQCELISNEDEVKRIFNKMIEEKNTHFKEYVDNLVVLRLVK